MPADLIREGGKNVEMGEPGAGSNKATHPHVGRQAYSEKSNQSIFKIWPALMQAHMAKLPVDEAEEVI